MRRKILSLFLVIILSLGFCVSCGEREYIEDSFFGMDTHVTLKTNLKGEEAEKLFSECKELLLSLDGEFSRHAESSAAYKYNNGNDGIEMSKEFKELLEIAEEIRNDTDGAFTVTAGALTELWEKCDESEKLPSDEDIASSLATVGSKLDITGDRLEKSDVVLEFGAIAKGYACDKLVEYMKKSGSESGMVSFTSTIGVFGENPSGNKWKIAIKNPKNTGEVLGYVSISDSFLSVSGDYERFYEIDGEKYNHIIDMKTGRPTDNGVHSVAVVADSGAVSDAMATALFVMGPTEAMKEFGNSEKIAFMFVMDDEVIMNTAMSAIYK